VVTTPPSTNPLPAVPPTLPDSGRPGSIFPETPQPDLDLAPTRPGVLPPSVLPPAAPPEGGPGEVDIVLPAPKELQPVPVPILVPPLDPDRSLLWPPEQPVAESQREQQGEVPEPGSVAALVGAALAMLVVRRRKPRPSPSR
jgi:hypothetical protein